MTIIFLIFCLLVLFDFDVLKKWYNFKNCKKTLKIFTIFDIEGFKAQWRFVSVKGKVNSFLRLFSPIIEKKVRFPEFVIPRMFACILVNTITIDLFRDFLSFTSNKAQIIWNNYKKSLSSGRELITATRMNCCHRNRNTTQKTYVRNLLQKPK